MEALFAAQRPLSAVELERRLGVDQSSVYRNLEVLEHLGVVRQIHLGRGPGRYVLVGREALEFLYCESCDTLTALDADELEPVHRHPRQRFGYEARFTQFALVGRCSQCLAEFDPGARNNVPGACDDGRRHPVRPHPQAGAAS